MTRRDSTAVAVLPADADVWMVVGYPSPESIDRTIISRGHAICDAKLAADAAVSKGWRWVSVEPDPTEAA